MSLSDEISELMRDKQRVNEARSAADGCVEQTTKLQVDYDRKMAVYTAWVETLTASGIVVHDLDPEDVGVLLRDAWAESDPETRGPEPRYPHDEEQAFANPDRWSPGVRLARLESAERELQRHIDLYPKAARKLGLLAEPEPAAPKAESGSAETEISASQRTGRSRRRLRHGDAKRGREHPVHVAWRNMIQRCTNPKDPYFADYGARGIGIDPDWRAYERFKADMLPSWRSGLTLERIDNSLGYSCENCMWASLRQQAKNRRAPRTTEMEAETP